MSKITAAAEKGMVEVSELWLKHAREGGFMVQRDSVVISDSMSSINDDVSRPLLHVSNANIDNMTNIQNTTIGATVLESRYNLENTHNDSNINQYFNMTAEEGEI